MIAVMPRAKNCPASVTMKGCMLNSVISQPWTRPNTAPMASTIRMTAGAGRPVFCSICADDIQVSATTEPMEISIPPISRTKVMPMVAIIRAALSISRLQNTWGFMKPR